MTSLAMTSFEWKRPHHTRWLTACLIGLALAVLIGGFDFGLAALFVIIFAVGAVVLSFDGLGAADPEPYPEEIESSEESESPVTPIDDQDPA